MKSVVKIINKKTGEQNIAVYAANRFGNMQYNVDGKFLSDLIFNRRYRIVTENELIIKTPQQNIIETLSDKKMLFIERDDDLYHGLEKIKSLLDKNKIENTCLFNASEKNIPQIVDQIMKHDGIIFRTNWNNELVDKLRDFMYTLRDKKIIIESYISEPRYYYKPKDLIHDFYICQPPLGTWEDNEEWKFLKLSANAYWDYKNKFDK